MPLYKNLDGNSGIVSYEYDATSIEVVFGRGRETAYLYTYASAGSNTIEQMKQLADSGRGLNEYINRFVKDKYASKK